MIDYAKKLDKGAITGEDIGELIELMPKYMPGFIFGEQNDAGECLSAILNGMIGAQFRFPVEPDENFVQMY